MANIPKSNPAGQGAQGTQSSTQQGAQQGVGSPISNDAYNVITALQAKLEGLEAYRKYAKDENANLWQELTRIELSAVEKLVGELERLVSENKLRMQAPGRTH